MKKIITIAGLWVLASTAFAFTTQQFHNDNADQALRGFPVLSKHSAAKRASSGENPTANGLILKRERTYHEDTRQFTTTYYQYYQGIRVLDGEVTIHESNAGTKERPAAPEKKVVGQLLQNIDVNPVEVERFNTAENLDKALADAKTEFLQKHRENTWDLSHDKANLVIKNEDGKLKLYYEVIFYAKAKKRAPMLYHVFLDPHQQNKVIKVWNDIMHFSDQGPGGNDKTKEYHYGIDGIPFLNVNKQNGKCVLHDKTSKLLVVDMSTENPELDKYYQFMKPYTYQCNSETRDATQFSGAFSPADDAYFFGHLVQQVYQDWYSTKVLNLSKIALRVHYSEFNGEPYDNAFWDSVSSTMNFGDGVPDRENSRGKYYGFYPFVSLDVTAHEMSHGFTSAHSNLQ
jgi:vibriolysin